MELNTLLSGGDIDPAKTLVLRHRPTEPVLRRALPLLAAERLDIFDAYQAYQNPSAQRSFEAQVGGWLASFLNSMRPGQGHLLLGCIESADAEPGES